MHEQGDSAHDLWASRRGIVNVIVARPVALSTTARWGGPVDILRALLPLPVPVDVREFISPDMIVRLRALHSRDPVDAVWAQRSWRAEEARQAGLPNIICDIGDFQNAFLGQATDRLAPYIREPLHRLLNARLRSYEYAQPRRFARVTVTKAEDLALVDSRHRERTAVIPNGFDLPAHSTESTLGTPSCLFVGMLGYWPNIDAIKWFYSNIFPRIRKDEPSCRLVIAGRGPIPSELDEIGRDPIVAIVESPDSLDQLYANTSVVVAPIRFGHGTKIKALEALAHARPLVATTEAVRGHPIIDNRHALVTDAAEEFAEACIDLLRDHQRAARLAECGRGLAESIGGWNFSVECTKQVIDGLLGQSDAQRRSSAFG